MARFYQAVELEESENAKKRSASIEPVSLRSRLSSIGDNAHSLEQKNSLKRKSAELIAHGVVEVVVKIPLQIESNTESNENKTKSAEINYNEIDETEDERDLKKEILDSQSKLSFVKNLTPSSSIEYEDDYTDSTASSASVSSLDSLEKFKSTLLAMNKPVSTSKPNEDNELNTYHPMMEPQSESSRKIIENPLNTVYDIHMRREEFSNDADVSQSIDDEELYESDANFDKSHVPPKPEPRALSPYRIPEPDQSTIALTKPLPVPSADFVPKPILKTSSTESDPKEKENTKQPKVKEKKKERKGIMQLFGSKKTSSNGSLSSPQSQDKLKVEKVDEKMSAAALAKKKSMEQRQSSIEEAKVAVDHYSEIVKEMSVLKKPKVPLYLSSDELKKAAERAEEETQEPQRPNTPNEAIKPKIETERKESFDRPPVARRSTSRESDSRSIFAIKLSKDPKKIIQREEIIRSQLSIDSDVAASAVQSETTKSQSIDLNLNQQVSEPNDLNKNDAQSRGRSSTVNKIPTKQNPSTTRSRSSSALRNKSVQIKESDDKPPPRVRTLSKTRNRSESKSPSVKNRTKLHQTNTIRVTRLPLNDSEPRSQTPEELMEEAEVKVKSTMNYVMDLALFVVACWVYIFKDAWMAVPILSLMVGRQVSSTLKDKFPKWMKRKRD